MSSPKSPEVEIIPFLQRVSNARADVEVFTKNKEVNVNTDRFKVKYNYTGLDVIAPKINEICKKHNLCYNLSVRLKNDIAEGMLFYSITYEIINAFDVLEKISEGFVIPYIADNNLRTAVQTSGSILTYARRYALLLAFNIATEDEEDLDNGNNHLYKEQSKSTAKPPAKSQPISAPQTKTEPKPTNNTTAPKAMHITVDEYNSLKSFVIERRPDLTESWAGIMKSTFNVTSPTTITPFIREQILKTYNLLDEFNNHQHLNNI